MNRRPAKRIPASRHSKKDQMQGIPFKIFFIKVFNINTKISSRDASNYFSPIPFSGRTDLRAFFICKNSGVLKFVHSFVRVYFGNISAVSVLRRWVGSLFVV